MEYLPLVMIVMGLMILAIVLDSIIIKKGK